LIDGETVSVSNKTFHVTVPVADEDIAADRLWQLGVEAVGIGDEVDGIVELWTSVGSTDAAIERAVAALESHWTWRVADVIVPDETWRDYVAPTWYRTDGVVVPSWQSPESDVTAASHVTLIEPASSFGLGDHPTTKLSLRLLSEHLDIANPARMLDVGCGSGVLGILAAQRGVETIRATDISAGAVEATIANAALNGVTDHIDVDMATLGTIDDPFDIVVANILAPVLVALAPDLRRLIAPGGTLIISGVLAENHRHVLDSLAPLVVVGTVVEDGWAAIALRN
jgi:ribosomal protein L11 methyltransferase